MARHDHLIVSTAAVALWQVAHNALFEDLPLRADSEAKYSGCAGRDRYEGFSANIPI